jgi:hypothetical protein
VKVLSTETARPCRFGQDLLDHGQDLPDHGQDLLDHQGVVFGEGDLQQMKRLICWSSARFEAIAPPLPKIAKVTS